MRVLLTKLTDSRHALEVHRADGSFERRELETRSLLLHDLVHFALESAAGIEDGFWGRLAAGSRFDDLLGGPGEESSRPVRMDVERVVAMLQTCAKSGADADAAHRRLETGAAAQDEELPAWVTREVVIDAFDRLRRVLGAWRSTPFHVPMELRWPQSAGTETSVDPC